MVVMVSGAKSLTMSLTMSVTGCAATRPRLKMTGIP
jgi:hypothetical protein